MPAGGAYRKRQNAGVIEASGVEAEARGEWNDALNWRMALNYTNASFEDGPLAGLRPVQSPRWSASAGVNWRVSETATLSSMLLYESGRFEDDLNRRELASLVRLDLRAEQRLSERLFVFAALDNALDADIETAETGSGVESFAAPRTLRAGLTWRR